MRIQFSVEGFIRAVKTWLPISKERASFNRYMSQIAIWASAFDQDRVEMSDKQLDALYDDDYFDAMELQESL